MSLMRRGSVHFSRVVEEGQLKRLGTNWINNCERKGIPLSRRISTELEKRIAKAGTKDDKAKLSFSYCSLQDDQFILFIEELSKAPIVSKLEVDKNSLSSKSISRLSSLLTEQLVMVSETPLDARLNVSLLGEVFIDKQEFKLDGRLLDEVEGLCSALKIENAKAHMRKIYQDLGSPSPIEAKELQKLWLEIIGEIDKHAISQALDSGRTSFQLTYLEFEKFLIGHMAEKEIINRLERHHELQNTKLVQQFKEARLKVQLALEAQELQAKELQVKEAQEKEAQVKQAQEKQAQVKEAQSSSMSLLFNSADPEPDLSNSDGGNCNSSGGGDGGVDSELKKSLSSSNNAPSVSANSYSNTTPFASTTVETQDSTSNISSSGVQGSATQALSATPQALPATPLSNQKRRTSIWDLFKSSPEAARLNKVVSSTPAKLTASNDSSSRGQATGASSPVTMAVEAVSPSSATGNDKPLGRSDSGASLPSLVSGGGSGSPPNSPARSLSPTHSDVALDIPGMPDRSVLFDGNGIAFNAVVQLINLALNIDSCKLKLSTVDSPAKLNTLVLRSNNLINPDSLNLQATFPKLAFIDLANNNISEFNCSKFPKSLVRLDLSYNKISDTTNIILASCLQSLDISYNRIRHVSTLPATLERLDISHNLIMQSSGLRVLAFSTKLAQLWISGNPFKTSSSEIVAVGAVVSDMKVNLRAILKSMVPSLKELDGEKYPVLQSEKVRASRAMSPLSPSARDAGKSSFGSSPVVLDSNFSSNYAAAIAAAKSPPANKLMAKEIQSSRDQKRYEMYSQKMRMLEQSREAIDRKKKEGMIGSNRMLKEEDLEKLTKRLIRPTDSYKNRSSTPNRTAYASGSAQYNNSSDNNSINRSRPTTPTPTQSRSSSANRASRSSTPNRTGGGYSTHDSHTVGSSSSRSRDSFGPSHFRSTQSRDMHERLNDVKSVSSRPTYLNSRQVRACMDIEKWVSAAQIEIGRAIAALQMAVHLANRQIWDEDLRQSFSSGIEKVGFYRNQIFIPPHLEAAVNILGDFPELPEILSMHLTVEKMIAFSQFLHDINGFFTANLTASCAQLRSALLALLGTRAGMFVNDKILRPMGYRIEMSPYAEGMSPPSRGSTPSRSPSRNRANSSNSIGEASIASANSTNGLPSSNDAMKTTSSARSAPTEERITPATIHSPVSSPSRNTSARETVISASISASSSSANQVMSDMISKRKMQFSSEPVIVDGALPASDERKDDFFYSSKDDLDLNPKQVHDESLSEAKVEAIMRDEVTTDIDRFNESHVDNTNVAASSISDNSDNCDSSTPSGNVAAVDLIADTSTSSPALAVNDDVVLESSSLAQAPAIVELSNPIPNLSASKPIQHEPESPTVIVKRNYAALEVITSSDASPVVASFPMVGSSPLTSTTSSSGTSPSSFSDVERLNSPSSALTNNAIRDRLKSKIDAIKAKKSLSQSTQ